MSQVASCKATEAPEDLGDQRQQGPRRGAAIPSQTRAPLQAKRHVMVDEMPSLCGSFSGGVTVLLPWGAVRSVGAVALPWAQLRAEDLVPHMGNLPEVM